MKRVDLLVHPAKGTTYDVVLKSTEGERFVVRIGAADPIEASLGASEAFQRERGIVTFADSVAKTDWEGLVDRYFAERREAKQVGESE